MQLSLRTPLAVIGIVASLTVFTSSLSFADPSVSPDNACNAALDALHGKPIPAALYQERFLSPLVGFENVLTSSPSAHAAVLTLTQTDYRRYMFRLEGLFRFYEKAPWAGTEYTQWRMKFKRLEDALGVSVDAGHMVQSSQSLHMPAPVTVYLQKAFEKDNANLEELLITDGWYGNPSVAIADLIRFLNQTEIPSERKDADFVSKRLRKELHFIAKDTLDMHNLPNGLHELRRRLRWILIGMQGLRGKVEMVTDETIPEGLAQFQNLDASATGFLQFDKTTYPLTHVVQVSNAAYRSISFLVDWIGGIKDRGELHETMQEALVQSHLYPTDEAADVYLIPILEATGWSDFYPEGQKAHDQLMASGLLTELLTP